MYAKTHLEITKIKKYFFNISNQNLGKYNRKLQTVYIMTSLKLKSIQILLLVVSLINNFIIFQIYKFLMLFLYRIYSKMIKMRNRII
jgi:hypothetical protein